MEVVQRDTGASALKTYFGENFRALDETVRKAKTAMIATHKKEIQIKSRLAQTTEQSRSATSLANVISIRQNIKETTILIKEAQENMEEVEDYLKEAQAKLDLGYSQAALSVFEDTAAGKSIPKLREMEEDYGKKLEELSEDWKKVTLNITEWNETLRKVNSTSYINWPRVVIVFIVCCLLSVSLIMLSTYVYSVRIMNIIIFVIIYILTSWESLQQTSDLQKRTILTPLILYNLEASVNIIYGVVDKRITESIYKKCNYVYDRLAKNDAKDIVQDHTLCWSLSECFSLRVIFGALLCVYYVHILYTNNDNKQNRSAHITTMEGQVCFLVFAYVAAFLTINFVEYTIGCPAPRLYTMLIVYIMFTVNNVFQSNQQIGIMWFSLCAVPFYVVSEACDSEYGIMLSAFAFVCFNQTCLFVSINVVGIIQFMARELCDHLSGWVMLNVSKI